MTNNNQKIFKGYWWRPSEPDKKAAGVLTFTSGKSIVLELIGDFDKDAGIDLDEIFSDHCESVIHGLDSDAKEITLLNCRRSINVNFSVDFPIITYYAALVVYDKHVSSLDEKCRYRVVAEFPELSLWCPPEAITQTIHRDNGKIVAHTFTLPCISGGKTINESELGNGVTLSLKSVTSFRYKDSGCGVELGEYTILEITSKFEMSIDEILKLIRRFEKFLSLVSKHKTVHERIYLQDDFNFQDIGNGDKIYFPIDLFMIDIPDENPVKNKAQFLFRYTDVAGNFPAIMRRWMTDDELLPIESILVDSIPFSRVFKTTDSLSVVQGIEGVWWRFREECYKKKNGISKNSTTPLATVIKELQQEFSFIPSVASSVIDCEAVRDSRHYYSHLMAKDKKPKALEGLALFDLSESLKTILICCVLRLLGLNDEQISKTIGES